ncbi:hypothetical protein AWZ03_007623 [Drosophila navojoa]|uniref:Uncharacterized protein n=1 Tax=Drosophila navojoa TaxID=7232 RepID=A0A484BAS4_DRONA|nr:hypothetical protein AWZ03_007623 [Drosophila navojoa]
MAPRAKAKSQEPRAITITMTAAISSYRQRAQQQEKQKQWQELEQQQDHFGILINTLPCQRPLRLQVPSPPLCFCTSPSFPMVNPTCTSA